MFGVGIVLFDDLTCLERKRFPGFADEKTRPFLKTHNGMLRGIGLGIEPE